MLRDEKRIYPINIHKDSIKDIIKELNIEEGFNLLFEMSGNNVAFESLIEESAYGGQIISLGIFADSISLDFNKVIFKNLNIRGIYGREIFDTWYKMTAYLQSGLDLKKVITHRFHYRDFAKGFEILKAGQACKVILEWD